MHSKVLSRREVEGLIAEGRKIIIFEGRVIKADAWLPFHPGGDKAILHMVGRDGTDEIRALHSAATQAYMQKFVIGTVEGRWHNFLPPIQGGHFRKLDEVEELETKAMQQGTIDPSSSSSSTSSPSPLFDPVDAEGPRKRRATSMSSTSSISLADESSSKPKSLDDITNSQIKSDLSKYPSLDHTTQDAIVSKYRELDAHLHAAGLYDCPYAAYAWECLRYALLFASFATSLHFSQYALAGAFLGLFWHQLVFTAHDAGHMGITHNFHIDTTIGIFIADFLGGLSLGWWKRNHNVHHIVTNAPEHDPDISHMPFFAISHRFFTTLHSTYYDRPMPFSHIAQFAIRHQHLLYYPLLLLGRFNLYLQSYTYLLSPTQPPRRGPARFHLPLELLGHLFFLYWFAYQTLYLRIPNPTSRLTFLLTSHALTSPLHVQITLSHFSMSTSDLGPHESFPQKMLRTTMDITCPAWLDFVHGGLQFQAVHHLFPRLPRHNLRRAQPLVKAFCGEVGIPYVIYGFARGNREVLGRLGEVARQVEIFEECRRVAVGDLVGSHGHGH